MADLKYKVEGNKIIKRSNGEAIPDDEPIFILRGRDRLSLRTVAYYLTQSSLDGCTMYHIDGIHEAIQKFRDFQIKHSELMKQPGITLDK